MDHTPLIEDVEDRARLAGASGDVGDASPEDGQKVLVLQGGGALGAYQGGVFQALEEGGLVPDWVIGTSIGAVNAAIIAGNRPEDRLTRLQAFWRRLQPSGFAQAVSKTWFGRPAAEALMMASGIPGFFEPNMGALAGPDASLGPERAGLYSMEPLQRTLAELVDFDRLNDGPMRLTVGAAELGTAEMRYFDSRQERLGVAHIMASCALPPAFPAVRINGTLYWDGGVVSNTPVEAVFDDNPRRSGLIFTVHMWSPEGPEPKSLNEVMAREKDVRYSSRAVNHIARQKQLHKLRHVIAELTHQLDGQVRERPDVKALLAYGCMTRMHVVRLLAPTLPGQNGTMKDIDFSAEGVAARWRAGRADTLRVLQQAPWRGAFDPLEGFILHEAVDGTMVADG